jgi:hypothetical protein
MVNPEIIVWLKSDKSQPKYHEFHQWILSYFCKKKYLLIPAHDSPRRVVTVSVNLWKIMLNDLWNFSSNFQKLRYLKLVFNYKYIIYFDEICVFHVNMYTYLYIHVYQPYISVASYNDYSVAFNWQLTPFLFTC